MPIGLASEVGVKSLSFLPYARGAWARGLSAAAASRVTGDVPGEAWEELGLVGPEVGAGGLSARRR